MAFEIAKAWIRIIVDRSGMKKELADGKKDMESFSSSAKDFAKEIGSEVRRMFIGAGLAATIIETAKAAFEGAAGLHELAQETGFTAEQLSRLQYVSGKSAEE